MHKAKYHKLIMLVDNRSLDLYIHQELLKYAGYSVCPQSFANPVEALFFLEKCSADQFPGLILLDIQMPRLDGFGFLDRLRTLVLSSNKPAPHVLLLSSSLHPGDLTRARSYPSVNGFIRKPLDMEEFAHCVDSLED